jgi:hypothetical protein
MALPAPRADAAVAAASDGILLLGGTDGSTPQTSVWKARFVSGKVQKWADQAPLLEPNAGGVAAVVGNDVWLMGGSNASAPVRTVQIGRIGSTPLTGPAPSASASAAASAAPGAVATDTAQVTQFRVSEQTNLPEPRTDAAGFTANGTLYFVGGSDGSTPRPEVWWAIPDASGAIPGWKHLPQTDLGIGLTGASGFASGSQAFVFGGQTPDGIWPRVARTNLAPQEPFFQLGLVGATVPALKIDGEIGQQLGYLNAAGAGTVNFVLLLLIGWAYAHKEQTRAIVGRLRNRRRR